mmetsp:Transcript_6537/g.22369  ORF Transcript_6537/g.22369 Transcript_6537/m.22369 type:complete len:97 (+) Transcript_6537:142-432(+)
MSSLCVPVSTTRPWAMTMMLCALAIVDRRWAMTMVVRPTTRRSSAERTRSSDFASSADVASSKISTGESLRSARAMAMRCFWPPEICTPRSPQSVS